MAPAAVEVELDVAVERRVVERGAPDARIEAALVAELERAMKEAAKRLDFERAAELRDRVKALKKIDLEVR